MNFLALNVYIYLKQEVHIIVQSTFAFAASL